MEYWHRYYDSQWQALATLVVHGLCAVILFILLMIIAHHFFDAFRCFHSYKLNRIIYKPPDIGGRVSDVSNASAHFEIRKSSQSDSNPISPSLKVLTTLSLSLMFLYSATSLVIRILMVFYNVEVHCLVREHTIGLAFMGRICLLCIWLHRIFTSFRDTVLAYSNQLLLSLSLTALLLILTSMTYFYVEVERHRNGPHIASASQSRECTQPGYSTTTAVLPYFLCEFVVTATLVLLFCRKLLFSLRLVIPDGSAPDTMEALKSIQMVQLMAKMTLLMSFTFVSTLLIVTVMVRYLSSACISLDNLVNVVSMLLLFKRNQAIYHLVCCCCSRLCVQLCMVCCIDNIQHSDRGVIKVTKCEFAEDKGRASSIATVKMRNPEDAVTLPITNVTHHHQDGSPERDMLSNDDRNVPTRIGESQSDDFVVSDSVYDEDDGDHSVDAGFSGYFVDDDDAASSDSANIAHVQDEYLNALAIIFLNDSNAMTPIVNARVPYFNS